MRTSTAYLCDKRISHSILTVKSNQFHSLLQNLLDCINIPKGVLWINDSIIIFLIKLLLMNMALGKLSACLGDIISIRNFKNYGRMLENFKIVKKPFRLHYWNLTSDLIEMKKIFIYAYLHIYIEMV